MGMITCARGCRHWGRHGAAGLLLVSSDSVLLQLRANSHHSGTWSTPGGSLEPGETPLQAAFREVHEELRGVPPVSGIALAHVTDHGGWAYRTFVGSVDHPMPVWPRNGESERVSWIPIDEVDSLTLHPGFAHSWPALRSELIGDRVAA